MSDDFCLIHGYEFIKSEFGNPFPRCTACDDGLVKCENCERLCLPSHKDGPMANTCSECVASLYNPPCVEGVVSY